MALRDRHEFAFHILKFLIQNLLKLVHRKNATLTGERLLASYFEIFLERAEPTAALFRELERKKQAMDFTTRISELDAQLEAFLGSFDTKSMRYARSARTFAKRPGTFYPPREPH